MSNLENPYRRKPLGMIIAMIGKVLGVYQDEHSITKTQVYDQVANACEALTKDHSYEISVHLRKSVNEVIGGLDDKE